ncbi:PRD domain-containing protein [Bacillus alkalicola]|uniref:PRD domain-containing protein n=2 Tax=Bacillales TaxID=1385 RepID=A0ABS6JSA3_9BACI|nr:PRD domain-containing protein [Bacillus alkalicola]MBU9721446.1 PRD domain-containing protein [Bacillus alkalicola]
MRISRILNNNAIVVIHGEQEKIVMGSGIAFQKSKNDIVPQSKIEKVFVLHEHTSEKFQQLLSTLPEKHIELAELIIDYAEGYLEEPLHDHIHIALTDHLSFAIERIEQGFTIQNKLTNEIKLLYHREFQIGLWARKLINETINIEIPLDEVAHIALHIHTAKIGGKSMSESMEKASIIRDFIELVERHLNIKVNESSINYQRLITHLRFALNRMAEGSDFDPIDPDMHQLIKEKYSSVYEISEAIASKLNEDYKINFPSSEIAYITLHLQRLI